MNKFRIRVVAMLTLLGQVLIAQAASDLVLIDHGEPAFTVYAGLPAERADEIRAKISGQPAQLVSFREFSDERARYIGQRIVSDDYPGSRAQEGLVALVQKYPGTPFGITWNGGIAFTRMDYQYAKRQFAGYSQDAQEYSRNRQAAPAVDPLNPKANLGQLLGW